MSFGETQTNSVTWLLHCISPVSGNWKACAWLGGLSEWPDMWRARCPAVPPLTLFSPSPVEEDGDHGQALQCTSVESL